MCLSRYIDLCNGVFLSLSRNIDPKTLSQSKMFLDNHAKTPLQSQLFLDIDTKTLW